MTAPDAPFPTTAASSPGRFPRCLRGGVRRGRRGDRLDPRRRDPVGCDQERPDRARHAARPRDPDRRFAQRLDGDRAPRTDGPGTGGGSTCPASEIADELEERALDLRIYFALETLEYLKKGGRISGTQAAIGTLLSVKPVIMVKHGRSTTVDKVRTRSKARDRVIELTIEKPVERLASCTPKRRTSTCSVPNC